MTDKQVKSKQRVADHGEVFTAEREVKAMCDLVADECLRIDSRFLEPACGDGNFLQEILTRKLEVVTKRYKKSPYDYDLLYDKGYTMDYADFEGSVNLAQLEAGTYRIYLDISNEQYRDISEFMNFGKKLNKSIELDGKTITLSTSKVHNRFILEVTE